MKFLVKEIKSKTGKLHFRRWRLLELPFFAIYIHAIYRSDEDLHPHNHPWHFFSLILKGQYKEKLYFQEHNLWWPMFVTRGLFSYAFRDRNSYHKIELINKPVYSLVFTLGKKQKWGYLVRNEFFGYTIMDNEKYRSLKNSGKLVNL